MRYPTFVLPKPWPLYNLMSTQDDGIKKLQARLELLFAQQERFAMQIDDLKIELSRYQKKDNKIEDGSPPTTHLHEPSLQEGTAVPPVNSIPVLPATQSILPGKPGAYHERTNTYVKPQPTKRDFSNLEKLAWYTCFQIKTTRLSSSVHNLSSMQHCKTPGTHRHIGMCHSGDRHLTHSSHIAFCCVILPLTVRC